MASARIHKRRLAIRLTLTAALIALGILMYNIGKEYSVLLDNGAVTIDGKKYAPVAYGALVVDGDEKNPADIWEDDRMLHKFTGVAHTFTLKVLDEDDDSVVETIERAVRLDFDTRQYMISLAAIAGKAENVLAGNPMYSAEAESLPDDDTTEQNTAEEELSQF